MIKIMGSLCQNEFVIPGLTRNPEAVLSATTSGFPLEFIPYLIRGGNDSFSLG